MLGVDEWDVLVNEWDSIPVPLPGCLLDGRNLQIRREFRMLVGFPGPFLPLIPFGGPFLTALLQIPCGFLSVFPFLNLFLILFVSLFVNFLTDNPFHYPTCQSHFPVLSSC